MWWEFKLHQWHVFSLKLQTKIDWLWAVGWSCIDRWLQTKQFICPVCRKEVPFGCGGCHETDVEDASFFCFLTVLRGICIYIYNLYSIPILHIIYIHTRISIRMGFDLFALRYLHVDGETCNILSKPAQRWCLMEWQYKAYQIMWLRNYKMVMWQSPQSPWHLVGTSSNGWVSSNILNQSETLS